MAVLKNQKMPPLPGRAVMAGVRERRTKKAQGAATMNAVKLVERALAILKTFDDKSPFLTAQEIANRIVFRGRPFIASSKRFARTIFSSRPTAANCAALRSDQACSVFQK